ncbi:MAG: cell division protein FtsW [Deltaproteobacteria bacterium]|nr:MAG: cell division protein FtsW [Deltaproteobacteria bacterium]
MSTVVHPQSPSMKPVAHRGFTGDWKLFGTVLGLALFGLLMILSASSSFADLVYGDSLTFVTRQVGALTMGAIAGAAVLLAPYRMLSKAALPAYIAAIIGLMLVFSPLGVTVKGATRWIWLGVNLQVSEFAKIALILILSNYLARNEGRLHDVVGVVLPSFGVSAPILLLVFVEPDFGTTVVLSGLIGILLIVAGLRLYWVAGLGLAALGGLAVMGMSAEYRMRRLTSFLDPFADPAGDGYQVIQGWIAMSSGGWTGRGLGTGVAQSGFLPEAHTDFISAVVAEELGVVGWSIVILGYVMLVWRGMRISERAPDHFGQLVAAGITGMLAAQACVNLGVVAGLAPAKGLVLPFMSYGASAALVHTVAVAILLRISMEKAPESPSLEGSA